MCKAPELYILNIIIHFIYIYREREKEMATHSSNLAWKIPWTEEPGILAGYIP